LENDQEAVLATFVVREIERMCPFRTVGRSLLQKLFFVLSREGIVDASFDLFLSGPYSERVESALDQAVGAGMLTVVKENGRSSISARGGIPGRVPPEIQGKAIQCVQYYGFNNDTDLAILTTALFLQDRGCADPEGLARAVIAINPHFDVRRVCSLLDRSDMVFRSW
jgi:hypothetical protein